MGPAVGQSGGPIGALHAPCTTQVLSEQPIQQALIASFAREFLVLRSFISVEVLESLFRRRGFIILWGYGNLRTTLWGYSTNEPAAEPILFHTKHDRDS